jgi:hypothetical protein
VFKDFVADNTKGKSRSSALMTHCRRELLHAQWDLLLDEEFIEAYEHGIPIQCCDEVKRRFYPRFFTYSADYKEKYGRLFSCYDYLTKAQYVQGHPRHHLTSWAVPLSPLPYTHDTCS